MTATGAGHWPGQRALAVTSAHATEFVGLDEGAARRLAEVYGHDVRVVTPGTRAVTADMRFNRLTLFLVDGVIVRADAG